MNCIHSLLLSCLACLTPECLCTALLCVWVWVCVCTLRAWVCEAHMLWAHRMFQSFCWSTISAGPTGSRREALYSVGSVTSASSSTVPWKSDKGSGAHGAAQCECLLASRSSSLTPLGVFRLCWCNLPLNNVSQCQLLTIFFGPFWVPQISV